MKSKIFKCATMSILFLLAIFCTQKVNAETYTGQAIWPSEYISNIYIKKVKPDGYTKYQQARFIRRSEDNAFVYCMQPYTDIDNNLPYYEVVREDYARVLGFTEAQWERISLLAYYGYQYNDNGYNHSDTKWYAITQVMIWRTTNPESDIYFTDTLNGSRTSKFDSEIAELENLVANHYKTPSLKSDIVLPIGSSTTISDANGILSNFRVSFTSNVNASISGNNLTITATGIGTGSITLEKKASKYEIPPIVYFSDHSQNVFRVGNYDPVYSRLTLKIVGGKVTPVKTDMETRKNTPQGEASLGGAVYGIYKEDGTKVGTVTTKENVTNTSAGGGNQIRIKCEIDDEVTYLVWYAHLYPDTAKVKEGDTVKAGEEIAGVGTTGYSTGPHLHYQVQFDGSNVDGMSLIDFSDKTPAYTPSFDTGLDTNPYFDSKLNR